MWLIACITKDISWKFKCFFVEVGLYYIPLFIEMTCPERFVSLNSANAVMQKKRGPYKLGRLALETEFPDN